MLPKIYGLEAGSWEKYYLNENMDSLLSTISYNISYFNLKLHHSFWLFGTWKKISDMAQPIQYLFQQQALLYSFIDFISNLIQISVGFRILLIYIYIPCPSVAIIPCNVSIRSFCIGQENTFHVAADQHVFNSWLNSALN